MEWAMIKVLFTRVADAIPEVLWGELLESVPPRVRQDVNRYRRPQDRQSRLLGKLLLRKCLMSQGYGSDCLSLLALGPFGRPFVPGGPEFSISHSGEFTVFAATEQGRIGIDIETISRVELGDFDGYLTPGERKRINTASDKCRAFYRLWTRKECVLKADGRGLLAPLEEARVDLDPVVLQGKRWFLREIGVHRDCMCHLATSAWTEHLDLREVPVAALL
jgi:4'-phosphopantetheinyl transferase